MFFIYRVQGMFEEYTLDIDENLKDYDQIILQITELAKPILEEVLQLSSVKTQVSNKF